MQPDFERRFGGLRRLYGDAAYARLRAARVAVVGLGGVGSWAAEALARCGVARLVLIDLRTDVDPELRSDAVDLRDRLLLALDSLPPKLRAVVVLRDVYELLPAPVDVLVDACDQVRAKLALAAWSLREGVPLVCVGAAGGKRQPQRVEVADLAEATHDPLLASLRQRLRKEAGAPRQGPIGVRCVFSRESVVAPAAVCEADEPGAAATAVDGSLNCHGYGSSGMVTAAFGMEAAAQDD